MVRRRWWARAGLNLAVVLSLLATVVPAATAQTALLETDGKVVPGFSEKPIVAPWILDSDNLGSASCSIYASLWVKEINTSGISRMRLQYHMYGAYSPISPWLAHQSTREIAYPPDSDIELPDDDRSFWVRAKLPHGVLTGDDGQQVVARFVGERPSIWNPDVVKDYTVGELSCDPSACLGETGLNTCAQNVPDDDATGGGGVQRDVDSPAYRDSDGDGITDDMDDTPNGECFAMEPGICPQVNLGS